MAEIHIGSKRKLRKVLADFERKGISHNLSKTTPISRRNGITVIVDFEKKEAIA